MMRGSRFRTIGCLFLLVIMAVVARSQGTVIALKRTDGLTAGGAVDARFNGAPVVVTTVGDSMLGIHQNGRWQAAGQNTISGGGVDDASYVLFKFDVSAVPAYSRINLAQLRLYTAGTGCASAATILTHDWKEGPGTGVYGVYPGAAGGVTYAHPIGYHTTFNRNASNGTTPPLQSWGTTSDQFFNPSVDTGSSVSPSANVGGYYVINVTSHVQAWVSGVKPNYGWSLVAGSSKYRMSESASDLQPVLFIDYSEAADATPPAATTDLTAGTPTSSSLTLTWMAPGDDGNTGTATSYDIRYSTSANIAAHWGAAKQVTDEPLPLEAGAVQSVIVSGLAANTTYYFAMKTLDDVPNGSPLIVVPGTTLPDVTLPATMTDLAVSNYTSDTITLSWTAPGDDDMIGTAASYDIRYSTTGPITDQAAWDAATKVTGEPAPLAAGTGQSMVVTGLLYDTMYYFAMKASDEVGNASGLSNGVSESTAVDTTAPAAVTNLAVVRAKSTALKLTWTAPGDDGASGKATSYDIRYSLSPISDGSWNAAAQVTGEPAPRPAGKSEAMIVHGLSPNVAYYFAIKTCDEVPNTSVLSNVATGQTLDNTAINRALLSKEDFEYLGAFTVPMSACGWSTAWSESGIALRRVNGQLRMLTGGHRQGGDPIYEVAVPDSATWSTHSPWPEAAMVREWGAAIYGSPAVKGLVNNYWTYGIMFDPATNRFYYSWGYWYNVDGSNDNCLAWAELNDAGPVVHGPWKASASVAHSNRIRGGSLIIPDWFANAYVAGRKLGLGFGGPYSGAASCSKGPYLAAAHHPSDSTTELDVVQLLDYPVPGLWYSGCHWGTRDADYTSYATDLMPAPVGEVGFWGNLDCIRGGCVWIDLADKQGLLYVASLAHGGVRYTSGQPNCDSMGATWFVYDPADLAAVAQGQMNPWQPYRDEWNMTYTPPPVTNGSGSGWTAGAAFDAQTRTLFVVAPYSWTRVVQQDYPLIHAWHIKESPLPRLVGDINSDGFVNVGDLQLLVGAWGSQAGPPPTAGWNADADINIDSYVNVGDLQLLVAHWGEQR